MDQLKNKPPEWSGKFLEWFCRPEYFEDIQGDLEEEFYLYQDKHSLINAKAWYNWQIFRLFRPGTMAKLKTHNSIVKEVSMLRNYFKIGIRNLLKYKSATAINITGLSTGMAAFVLITLFVIDEFNEIITNSSFLEKLEKCLNELGNSFESKDIKKLRKAAEVEFMPIEIQA